MIESQIRTLFAEIADGEPVPSRVDVPLAHRRGRARLRWRRATVAGSSVLAVAVVAVLGVTAGQVRLGSAPPAAGPAAPRQFNPLVPRIAFDWLPAGSSLSSGGVTPAESYMGAGLDWEASVYARGQCHLASSPGDLSCPGSKLRISRPAPDVAGHRAYWTGGGDWGPGIAWQYARGGWVQLTIPAPSLGAVLHGTGQLAADALRIARHVRYDVTTRLVFAAQFSGLPSRWRVHNVSSYVTAGGQLTAQEYMLATASSRFHPHVGDLGVWTGAPYIIVHPATRNGTCSPHDPASKNTSEVINGYHVVLKRMHIGGLPMQELCGTHADGLWFDIQVFGAHPSIGAAALFRDHMRLLGSNPANWTKNPIG